MVANCTTVYNSSNREKCIWGSLETLRVAINEKTKDNKTPFFNAKLYSLSFFRNEKSIILTVGDNKFKADAQNVRFTLINGSPNDINSKTNYVKISLFDGKKTIPLFEEKGIDKDVIFFSAIVEKGKEYSIIVEEIYPIASYFTLISSNKALF